MSIRPGQPRQRRALLLGCSEFSDPSLPTLRSPAADVRALAAVLRDPSGSNYEVTAEINIASHEAQVAIDRFLNNANTQDLHLIYFTGHGVQDARGSLFFAFTNTDAKLPSSTAVSADWIRERVNSSRSRSTVILLDCCFSGLFLRGMRGRAGGTANVASLVGDLPEGSGIAVLTASGETEYSLEKFDDNPDLNTQSSYFTEALVSGIGSGAADLDGDGRITVDELYDYVYTRLKDGPSPQRPRKMGSGEGHVVVALTTPRPARPLDTNPGKSEPSPLDRRPRRPAPEPRTVGTPVTQPTIAVNGILGKVTFDGSSVTITKTGYGPRMQGAVTLPVDKISAITVKPATRLVHGYIQFVLRTHPVAPIVHVGLAAGRPHREDPLSISFSTKRNDAILDLQKQIEAVLPHRPPRQDISTKGRSSSGPTPPSFPASVTANRPGSTGSSTPAQDLRVPTMPNPASAIPVSPAVEVDPAGVAMSLAAAREAELCQGHTDGAAVAVNIPFHAWASLIAAGYDILRWIEPWRQLWHAIHSGQAPPDPQLAKWLPMLDRHLGPSTTGGEGGTTRSTNYLEGFTNGIRETWHTAIRDRLLPPNSQAFDAWLHTPTQPPATPPTQLTITDLRIQVKHTTRNRTMTAVLRTVLWTITSVLALLELSAIGVSITGGWHPNNTTTQIIGNLMFGLPFAAMATALVFDTRQIRRRTHARQAGNQAATRTNGPQRPTPHMPTAQRPPHH